MTDLENLLAAVAHDRYDEVARKALADHYEELGMDDHAHEQRLWTREWQEAEDYLKDLHRKLSLENWYGETPSFDDMVGFIGRGELYCYGFDTPEYLYDEREKIIEMWSAYKRRNHKGEISMHCGC